MISLAASGWSSWALAEENHDPVIVLDDIFFQPQVRVIEEGQGSFGPIDWSLGAKTKFASWVDVRASIGAISLLFLPSWTTKPTNQVSVIDLVGTLHSLLGDFYAGQTLVPWGLQGQTLESQLWLPRDLFFEKGAFPLRDIGVGLRTELNGFYMNVMAHNGEGAGQSDQDNRMFLTAQWGVMGAANTNLGFSATAGRLAAPVVAGGEQHLRGANAFFGFNIFGLGLQCEGSYIQSVSDAATVDTLAWHVDGEHPITDNVNLIARYEHYNPNTRVVSNEFTREYLGGEYHSKNNISRLFLFFIKNSESLTEVPNDEVRLLWRISPEK